VIALGILLVLVGFALIVPRGAMPGSTAARNISMGRSQLFRTAGYQGVPSWRYRLIQTLMGLVVIAAGFVVIATSS
jgi:hypothetical protein